MRTPGGLPWVASRALVFLSLAVSLFWGGADSALAQSGQNAAGSGIIAGKVTDEDGKVLAYANVVVVGTSWGAFTAADGTFKIVNIPVGTYSVQVTILGYEDQKIEGVAVARGETASANFKIKSKPVSSLETVEIVASKVVIQKKRTDTSHQISEKDIQTLPIQELTDVIGLKAGVIAQGGELHFRGGRGNEVQYQVDGVPVRDPLNGGSQDLAAFAVENTEQIMGGLDAEYGNAQSGVVNYKTREGTDRFEGDIFFQTDNYGEPQNTYDNLDKVFVGLGGPTPVKKLTYFVSGEGTFQDPYPVTRRDRVHHRILNFISVGDRNSNTVRLQGKLAYKPDNDSKLTAEVLHNQERYDDYLHEWSRSGYVQTFRDTTNTGDVVLRHGSWSPTKVDSTYEYYNAADHTPTHNNHFTEAKLVWSHTLDAATFYTVKLNRNSFYEDARVLGQYPWEYEGTQYRDYWFDYANNTQSNFFVTAGDYPDFYTRATKVYTSKVDLTKKIKKHTFKTGIEASYNDMRYFEVSYPYVTGTNGEIGQRTKYHYYNPEGSYYLQDRWEHEGMVINMGLRYDFFSVGEQLALDQVQERVKQQFSPRIGIAYPISDRDAFSFHYGRFYQIPERQYLFDNLNVYDGRARGNPNLTNQTTVAYQAGIQHLFNETVSGMFAVYYKDIFGLLTQEQNYSYGNVGSLWTYVNRDYASARGFEATLTRRFANGFSGEINYTFGVATGVASDPNAKSQETFTYLPISEQPLAWDIRHSLNIQFTMAQTGNWLASMIWRYNSGVPYTPWGRETRELKPEVENSRRLPGTTSLDIQVDKYYQVWGQRFRVFLQSRNVLDSQNITDLSPSNQPTPQGTTIEDYQKYYTETGKAGSVHRRGRQRGRDRGLGSPA